METNAVNVTNNTTIRNDLMEVYNELRRGDIAQGLAKQLANIAGKAVSSGKAQLEYNKWIKNEGRIEFFEQ